MSTEPAKSHPPGRQETGADRADLAYTLAIGPSDRLVKEVNALLAEGWGPQGGVVVLVSGQLCQAMVRMKLASQASES